MRAKLTGVTSGGAPGDPARLNSRSCQSTIKRHPALCDNKRAPSHDPLVESLIDLSAFVSQNAISHVHTGFSQLHDAFAGVPRVYVNRADNNISHTSVEYRICAWSSAPRCRTWLQSNVQRGPHGHGRAEIAKAVNLSVIASRFPMVSFRYNPIVYDQNRANSRIRAGLSERLFCLV
jgi:hypothetical protein